MIVLGRSELVLKDRAQFQPRLIIPNGIVERQRLRMKLLLVFPIHSLVALRVGHEFSVDKIFDLRTVAPLFLKGRRSWWGCSGYSGQRSFED
jgi:hypothetical protein